VVRLDGRVGKLQRHFEQASEDVRQIRISTEKVTKRAERITEMEFETPDGTETELDSQLETQLDTQLDEPPPPQPALGKE